MTLNRLILNVKVDLIVGKNLFFRYGQVLCDPKTLTCRPVLVFIILQIYLEHVSLSAERLVCVSSGARTVIPWNLN